MKRVAASLAACLALLLTGCVLRGKQPVAKTTAPPKPVVAPAPPPPPKTLSSVQTNVELPAPQPVTPEALATTYPPEEPPPAPPAPKPPARTTSRQAATPRSTTEPVTPQGPPVPATVEPEPPRIQETPPPPDESRRLLDEAENNRKEILARIDAIQVHRLSRQQNILVNRIRTFVKQSNDAQNRGDMRQAAELAQRGLVLAKELQP
jgi:hypothetical protein